MNLSLSKFNLILVFFLAFATTSVAANAINVSLSGAQEVPAVSTAASGSGTITIGAAQSVSGSVTTSGVEGSMAPIHMATTGQNGPVIAPMTRTADNVWSISAGAKLTYAQYQSFKDNNSHINVHSANLRGGEVRRQLKSLL